MSGASAHLFVTGMPRSGTTLLDKLLSGHREVTVHSQPLPLLFSSVKGQFLKKIGRPSRYPISDMVHDNHYPPERWAEFLSSLVVDAELYSQLVYVMSTFGGQYTRMDDPLAFLDDFEGAGLSDFIKIYLAALGGEGQVLGLKETWCEEYLPYFIEQGFKCVLIVRDPRDVLCSLNHGRGRDYGGRIKPLLFNIRSWRKSIAFALTFGDSPMVEVIRYEDLVSAPRVVLGRLLRFLRVDEAEGDRMLSRIEGRDGKLWQSNSSHQRSVGISKGSMGKYRDYLAPEVIRFVEACCLAEMRCLDYQTVLSLRDCASLVGEFVANERIEREALAHYRWTESHREEELRRISLLADNRFSAQDFIFERAFERLSNSMSRATGASR